MELIQVALFDKFFIMCGTNMRIFACICGIQGHISFKFFVAYLNTRGFASAWVKRLLFKLLFIEIFFFCIIHKHEVLTITCQESVIHVALLKKVFVTFFQNLKLFPIYVKICLFKSSFSDNLLLYTSQIWDISVVCDMRCFFFAKTFFWIMYKHEAFNLYVFRDAYLRQFFSKKLYYKLHTRGFSPICFRRW